MSSCCCAAAEREEGEPRREVYVHPDSSRCAYTPTDSFRCTYTPNQRLLCKLRNLHIYFVSDEAVLHTLRFQAATKKNKKKQ